MTSLQSQLWRALDSSSLRRETPKGLDSLWHHAAGRVASLRARAGVFLAGAERVVALERRYARLSDAGLRDAAGELRALFRTGRDRRDDLFHAFALVREAAYRALGERAYPAQIAGALAAAAGCVAEMATGEGKTLAATMPATIAAWRGRGCHVVTANDYLARRDAEWMKPVYEFCGVRVGWITGEVGRDDRRRAYAADATYCTSKEVAADFLRDRLVLRGVRSVGGALAAAAAGRLNLDPLMQRGLECAIVDEADSVLIDDAVTPLILSADAPNSAGAEAFAQASHVASRLREGRDYRVDARHREVRLTPAGVRRVMALAGPLGGVWSGRRRAEELAAQALAARLLFVRDRDYIVRDGAVVIVDDSTGRPAPDRSWRDGLHQAIEAKEGLAIRAPNETLARISFQRFFRLYRRLAGMTGTAAEEAAELWHTYRLPTVIIPPNRPCRRVHRPDLVLPTLEAKWRAVADEVEREHASGRPVLIGARTVAQSELLSAMLASRGLAHRVLSATRNADEASIIAQAGRAGRITIATNMAGRGTDIRLGPGVADLGGLHVIASERHDSPRVDRQLFGRAGRQGDPGSARAIVSLEDDLVRRHGPRWFGLRRAPRLLFRLAQIDARRLARRRRRAVLLADDWLDDALGFAGEGV